jgi:predicted DNA-binding transcriptional regulator
MELGFRYIVVSVMSVRKKEVLKKAWINYVTDTMKPRGICRTQIASFS